MREFQKEEIGDLLFEAARKLEPVDLFYQLINKGVSRNEIGAACTAYEIQLSFVEGQREIELAVVDYGVDIMPTFHLRNLSNGSEMNVREYLSEKHDTDKVGDLFKLEACSNEQDLRLRLERFFDGTLTLGAKDFEEIVAGKNWVDLPFDWHGYR
jgi:hypothetical protein